MHFTIALCTAKRPNLLAIALQSLVTLSPPPDSTVSIVVIENDSEARSLQIIEEVRRATSIPIKHYLETKIGIPHARNRCLNAAIAENADWVAMIDDDERASPNWLADLYNACLKYNADVATGPLRQEFEIPPPHWWSQPAEPTKPTGSLKRDAYTNNVLFHSRLIAADGLNLRFDERFHGRRGGHRFLQARACERSAHRLRRGSEFDGNHSCIATYAKSRAETGPYGCRFQCFLGRNQRGSDQVGDKAITSRRAADLGRHRAADRRRMHVVGCSTNGRKSHVQGRQQYYQSLGRAFGTGRHPVELLSDDRRIVISAEPNFATAREQN